MFVPLTSRLCMSKADSCRAAAVQLRSLCWANSLAQAKPIQCHSAPQAIGGGFANEQHGFGRLEKPGSGTSSLKA